MSIVPTDPARKREFLAELLDAPYLLPEGFLTYINDYNTVNQAPVPISQVIGSQGFLERLDANTSTVTFTNNSSYQDYYTYNLPANTLQTKGAVRLDMSGSMKNNTASSQTADLKITYGSTIMWSDTSALITNNAITRPWMLTLILNSEGATNAQRLTGCISIGVNATATNGYGSFSGTSGIFPFGGTATENSKTKLTLKVSWKMNVADANFTISKFVGVTQRIAH